MDTFLYDTNNSQIDLMRVPAPIFPDFNSQSEYSRKMMNAKSKNDETFWSEMRQVFAHDFATLPKERFKVWASVWTVPFLSRTRYIECLQVVLNKMSEDELYREALKEPMIGITQEDLMYVGAFDNFPTTMNRVLVMANLLFCGFTAEKLQKMDKIVELGAGIGDMADVIYKLGFKGEYTIFDFPEIHNIQRWYHTKLGHKNISYVSNFEELNEADLCIATWSLTEMPLDLRDQIMHKIGNTKNYLIAYSNMIFNFDNHDYIMNNFLPRFNNHDIEIIDVPFMNWDGGTKYLIVNERA